MLQRKTHPFVARRFPHLVGWAVRRREEETLPQARLRLAALLLAAVLAGCTGSTSSPTPSPSAPISSSSPTPTLSDGPKAANDTVVKYRALIDELRSQDMPDVSRLLSVATGDAYEKWRFTIQDDFKNGQHQVGLTTFSSRSTSVGTTAREWIVSGCLDMSKADIVDKNGRSVMTEPPGKNTVVYTVDEESDQAWYVSREEVSDAC